MLFKCTLLKETPLATSKVLGFTAKKIIDDRIMLEAKKGFGTFKYVG
jgi:hypothetical protein